MTKVKYLLRQGINLPVFFVALCVFLTSWSQAVNAQIIEGTVVDATNEPLVGVIVRPSQNMSTGAATDINGRFRLNVSNLNYPLHLVFKYIGFDNFELDVYDDELTDVGTVVMKNDQYSLNDVVVIGYGESSRRMLTGSVAKVKGDVVADATNDSPILALQGNAAGVYVEQGSGVPGGANSKIVIRGYNTLSTNRYYNMPLYIVDGVTIAHSDENPVSYIKEGIFETPDPLTFLNPDDIESMEILKDADATAIYGTRGANGVVIITTKKGREGKTKVEFSTSATAQWMSKRLDYLSTSEYLEYRKQAFAADLARGDVKESDWNASNFPDIFLWDQDADYDWQSQIMGKTAWAEDVNLKVSGGNNTTSFLVSGSYYKSKTVSTGKDTYTRWTGRANVQHHSLDNRFNLEANVSVNNLSEKAYAAICSYAYMNTAPNTPPYDDNGNPYWIPDDPDFKAPLSGRGYEGRNDVTSVMANLKAGYNIWDKLVAKVNIGYNFSGSNQNNGYDSYYQNPYSDTSYEYGDYTSLNVQTVDIEPQLTYQANILGGKTDFLLGGTYEYTTTRAIALYTKGFPGDMFIKNAAAASIITTHNNPETQNKTASLFARVGYNYKERYLLNLTFRRDGSSHFGPGKRWGNFYSVGGGWIFSNEKFVKENERLKWLSFGKLRSSYGKTGNDNVGSFAYLTTYSVSKYPYNGATGIVPDGLSDENLHWETVKKFDLGLELGFLNDRILFSTNYYCNRSSEINKAMKVAGQSGSTSVTTNINALIQNTGWEFELNTRNIEKKGLNWTTSLNITIPRNKLLEYENLESSAYSSTYIIGKSINLIRRYKYLGIDNQTGVPMFEDVNGDGKLTSADYQYLGDFDPKMYGGLNNTVKWNGFTLDVSFYFRIKPNQNGFYYSYDYPTGMMYNVLREWAQNSWTTPGVDAKYPGLTTTTSSDIYTATTKLSSSDFGLSNGSYLKLSNIKLTYSLPRKLIRPAGIDNVSVYIQGNNLFTITGYDGYSPETANGYIPPLTSFSFGLNLSL